MGNTKTWGIAVVALVIVLLGVVVVHHSEMFGKKPHAVHLHWDASPNAASYNIYRRTENGAFEKIASSPTNSYVDTPVPSGSVFYYGVSTIIGMQESKISNVIRVEVPKD